jgi:chorismate-pyruvate lyase
MTTSFHSPDPLMVSLARSGKDLPVIHGLEACDLPEPYRALLVHQRDMTSTLESHYGSRTHLDVFQAVEEEGLLDREVILRLDRDERPVEYGAIRIYVNRFPEAARVAIREGERPLGYLLDAFDVAYQSRPDAFFRLTPTKDIAGALAIVPSTLLYGRRNVLVNPQLEPLAYVVEILAPADV